MKTLLFIFLLCSLAAYSQTPIDSLKQSVAKIELNLQKHSRQFGLGTRFLAAGVGFILINALAAEDNPAVVYIGTGLVTVGTIIQIDSHKWIGRAGRKRKR